MAATCRAECSRGRLEAASSMGAPVFTMVAAVHGFTRALVANPEHGSHTIPSESQPLG